MSEQLHKLVQRGRRQNRVRSALTGSADRPRLVVNVTNQHVSAQIIDDTTHQTLASATSMKVKDGKNLTDKAAAVGAALATSAKSAKIKQVVFDRGGKRYHGRVKALAEAARAGGLEF